MKAERSLAWKIFLTAWLVYTVHWAPFMLREHYPAVTLAQRGTLNVEEFAGWTDDIFRGPRGGAYINNNPGASILAAVPLFAARPALDAIARWNRTRPVPEVAGDLELAPRRAAMERRQWFFLAVSFVTVAGLMAPASALCAAMIARALTAAGVPRWAAAGVVFVGAFGTPVFFRTSYLNHNLLVGDAAVLGFLVLWGNGARRPAKAGHDDNDASGNRLRPWQGVAAGLLGGLAVLVDYTGVLVLGTLGIYLALRAWDGPASDRWRPIASYAAGALPALLALFLYQHAAFGNAALPSQTFMPASAPTSHGYRGFAWPSLSIAWMNFFDARFGLFIVAPWLAFGLAAPFVRGGRYRLPRRETWVILAFFAAFVLFCAANRYSVLQWTTGFRYLVPVVPGLLVLSAQVLQVMPRAVQWSVGIVAVVDSWILAIAHPQSQRDALLAPGGGLPLTWLHRLEQFGATAHPVAWTWLVLAVTAALVVLAWRNELGRAAVSPAPMPRA